MPIGGVIEIRLRISRVKRDNRFGFELIDDKSIKVSDIVGFISNNDEALLGLIESFEFFVQLSGDFFIGHVVGVSSLNDGQAGLSINDSVAAVVQWAAHEPDRKVEKAATGFA